ncbi:MAG: SH3 domain-containing protein [Clostridia bacterium]|nr:SH3 domain-containing protein [Clostridia bacterium]
MADNFDFDGSIFGNSNDNQNEGYSVPESADTDTFGAEDSYGDFYAPETVDQQPGSFEDFGNDPYEPRNDNPDIQDNADYDDYEERGIKAFVNSFGGKSRILLIVTIALLLIFLIVLLVSGRNANNKNKDSTDEDVSKESVVELSSDLPVNIPAEGQTYPHADNTGTYTVDTGTNPGLNLRLAASTSSEALTMIMNGDQVDVLFVDDFSDEGYRWGYVYKGDKAGWVRMDYLRQGNVEVTTSNESLG